MAIQELRHPVWTTFLLQLLLLLALLLGISVEGNTCGCWGTNQIYVHYRPPVSGWFRLSRRHNFLYERFYTVYSAEPQMHRFELRYMARRKYWILLEKKAGRWEPILSNSNNSNTERIIVSCPTGQCSCQVVRVNGSSCWSINGQYNKSSNNTQPRRNSTTIRPTEYKRRRSQCLLAQLARCLIDKKRATNVKDGCRKYTEPLISNSSELVRNDEKIYEMHNYKIKADKHDFWLIESEDRVYAVSRNIGPCPDQLAPDSSTWLRTDNSFSENVTVTCITWDSPSGD